MVLRSHTNTVLDIMRKYKVENAGSRLERIKLLESGITRQNGYQNLSAWFNGNSISCDCLEFQRLHWWDARSGNVCLQRTENTAYSGVCRRIWTTTDIIVGALILGPAWTEQLEDPGRTGWWTPLWPTPPASGSQVSPSPPCPPTCCLSRVAAETSCAVPAI